MFPFDSIASLGRFIDVNERFPLPVTISLEGSYALPITLVRHHIYAISVSGFPGL